MRGFSVAKLKTESEDGLNDVLLEEFAYEDKDGKVFTVPVGTDSDGASTPAILWEKFNLPWIPPFGWYWRAAFLHDWAYRDSDLPKDACDNLLLDAMEWLIEQKVKSGEWGLIHKEEAEIKSKIIYEGVHLGGWAAFEGDRKALASKKP